MNANTQTTTATNEEVRAMFDKMIDSAPDADTRAQRELLREYLLNTDFRKAMKAHLFEQQEGK